MSFSSDLIALNNKTNGKDKIFRTVQYSCKLVWYLLWKTKSNKEYIEILKKLESSMSSTRKVLRFGKSHEMIENALRTIHLDDHFLRYILTLCNINQACYLLLDNLLWLNSIGIINLNKKASEINKWSNKFWLFSSILYLARDIHDLISLVQNLDEDLKKKFDPMNKYSLNLESGAYTSSSSVYNNESKKKILLKLKLILLNKKNRPLLLDTAKNVTDIFLPLSSLDFIKLTPGMQGFFGLVSSLITLYIVWTPKYKLSP